MAKTNKQPKKTSSTKRVSRERVSNRGVIAQEADSIYILKLVLYLILGSQWLRITKGSMTIPLPLGLIVGLLFARTERFSLDRKIQYAILLLAMFIGFWLPIGLEIVL